MNLEQVLGGLRVSFSSALSVVHYVFYKEASTQPSGAEPLGRT